MPEKTPNTPPRTAEELKQMAEEIRRNVHRTVEEARMRRTQTAAADRQQTETAESVGKTEEVRAEISLEVDSLSPVEHSVPEKKNAPLTGSDDFWDLGKPKARVYQQPKFSAASLRVTDVTSASAEASAEISVQVSGSVTEDTQDAKTVQSEKILPREAYSFRDTPREVRSADRTAKIGSEEDSADRIGSGGSTGRTVQTPEGPRNITTGSYRSSYRRNTPQRSDPARKTERRASETVREYHPGGMLLRQIAVKTWESDAEFYGRFAADAHRSHLSAPKLPADRDADAVPYFSYVPQYAHMNLAQTEYYLWVRENIRRGRYPVCDLPYIQLYIFEIINLPDVIAPEEGVGLLASLWVHYRKLYPRLDGYLCEWLADYCMIHACPMPEIVRPILHEIVPKAQFKEFWLDRIPDSRMQDNSTDALGRTVLEVSSDYDYRASRYYRDNAAAYEEHIPAAVTRLLSAQLEKSSGIFALDRVYRMTRDSYCGAIVSSGIKRRLDIEFLSFTRRADTRQQVTAIAKYAENRLRMVLGIKAKLGVDKITPEDSAVIDAYFHPLLPAKITKPKEDRYMPDDYMKNYESEDSGFDFSAAQAIEAQSWVNTSRLTGDDSLASVPQVPEYSPDEEPAVMGELSSDHMEIPPAEPVTEEAYTEIEPLNAAADFVPQNTPIAVPEPASSETGEQSDSSEIREALRAALLGEYRSFCRRHNLYEGEMADRINNIFLDELGDVVLENSGGGFTLIEDYREDVEHWLS